MNNFDLSSNKKSQLFQLLSWDLTEIVRNFKLQFSVVNDLDASTVVSRIPKLIGASEVKLIELIQSENWLSAVSKRLALQKTLNYIILTLHLLSWYWVGASLPFTSFISTTVERPPYRRCCVAVIKFQLF